MAQVNNDNKVVYEATNEYIDIAPNVVTQFRGEQLIGGVSQGTVAENARPDITRPIQSPNFKQNTTGWRLNSNGILEAHGAIIT